MSGDTSITRSRILERSGPIARRPSENSLPERNRSARSTLSPPSRNSGDEICGAVVSVRFRHKMIALWTSRNASNVPAQLSIGKQRKEILDYHDSIGYSFHDDVKRLDRAANNSYSLMLYAVGIVS